MNPFDQKILFFINGFSQKSWYVDNLLGFFSTNNLFKGGIVIAILWGLWFTNREEEQEKIRKLILVTFVGTFFGLFITRVLVNILPFRARPIHNPEMHFLIPYGVSSKKLIDYAMSFPSDHATMFFGLATGIILISRWLGSIVLGYVFFNIFILRMYLGFHYPTDLIAGGFIGISFVGLMNTNYPRKYVINYMYDFSLKYPRIFYGMFFLVSYQTAILFDDVRRIFSRALRFITMMAR